MIYTLEYLKKEAEGIVGHWNGSDERFIDASGEARTEEDAQAAQELLEKIKEVEELIEELSL
jgi:hypothetical protein